MPAVYEDQLVLSGILGILKRVCGFGGVIEDIIPHALPTSLAVLSSHIALLEDGKEMVEVDGPNLMGDGGYPLIPVVVMIVMVVMLMIAIMT